jgi:hypothetical protein
MSSCRPSFGGEILDYDRIPLTGESQPAAADAATGPVRMRLTFPSGRTGHQEPLLTTGENGRGDVVFVSYLDERTVRFSLDHWGQAVLASPPIALDYRREHTLEIALGSLYPRKALAQFALGNAARAEQLRRLLQVRLDGQEVLAGTSDFYFTLSGAMEAGANRIGASSCEPFFTGTIAEIARPEHFLENAGKANRDYGPVRFTLLLPDPRPAQAEPLVASGRGGAGDVVSVSYPDSTHVRFTWDHWGVGGPSSELIAVDSRKWHEVEIDMGSFYPEESAAMKAALTGPELARRRRRLELRWDGATVLSADGDFYPATPAQVQLGGNSIGASGLRPLFTGTLEAVERPGVSPR